MSGERFIGLAALAVVAAGAATSIVSCAREEAAPAGEICLTAPPDLIEGMGPGCYDKAALAALRDKPVLDGDAPAELALVSEDDAYVPGVAVRTCADYDERTGAGYIALSSREMRREAVFARACGTLSTLAGAAPAATTFFDGDGLSADDAAAAARAAPILGEATLPDDVTATPDGAGRWRADLGGQTLTIQELAHADFDGDGIGDVLTFLVVTVPDGTAETRALGYLRKTAADAPATFVPIGAGGQG